MDCISDNSKTITNIFSHSICYLSLCSQFPLLCRNLLIYFVPFAYYCFCWCALVLYLGNHSLDQCHESFYPKVFSRSFIDSDILKSLNHISDKRLIYKIYMELKIQQQKTPNNQTKKWIWDLNRHSSKEGIQRSTGK